MACKFLFYAEFHTLFFKSFSPVQEHHPEQEKKPTDVPEIMPGEHAFQDHRDAVEFLSQIVGILSQLICWHVFGFGGRIPPSLTWQMVVASG